MNRIITTIKKYFTRIKGSIAFYPAIISSCIVLAGIAIMSIDQSTISTTINKQFSILLVKDIDTSRTILGALIGALISLMVFSFSMVMVVLNQAANSFSPRLLPGLISDKKHQIVLGFYLGAIIHSIITLLRLDPNDYSKDYIPSLGVLFAVILGIVCLNLFIYFIHSISQAVQISKILHRIFKQTSKGLTTFKQEQQLSEEKEPITNWQPIAFQRIGYIRNYNLSELAKLAEKKTFTIKTALPEGNFVSMNTPSFYVSKLITEQEKKELKNCISVDDEQWISEHPNVGIKQMVEIILKAMSPGINDPGTAITAIDYLGNLLLQRKQIGDFNCYTNKNGGKVYLTTLRFNVLLNYIFSTIRQYVRHDSIIMEKLLQLLYLLNKDEQGSAHKHFQSTIQKEALYLLNDAKKFIKNKDDVKRFEQSFQLYGF